MNLVAVKWGIRLFIAFLTAATMVAGTVSSAAPRYRSRSRWVAPGVTLKKLIDRKGPNRIRVLKVDPAKKATIDVALGTEELPGHEQTSSMARRHGAVGAINGDFTLVPGSEGSGRPVGTFIEDGSLKASPLIWERNFSITRDELTARVGHSRLKMWLAHPGSDIWDITSVNPVRPDPSGYSMYTPTGGKAFRPPRKGCAARLLPAGKKRWNEKLDGLTRDFQVDRVVCRYRRLSRGRGYVVWAPRSSLAGVVLQDQLTEGEIVTFGWSLGRPGVLDTIGGNPDLVEGGSIVVENCSYAHDFCSRHPRSGIGITGDGRILLVTVDGRAKSSVGMTLVGFARLFRYLGAESAMNLDGGGSTTMVVRNRIVNVPSGGYERPVGSALLVLPGVDRKETEPAPYITPSPTVAPTPAITSSDTELSRTTTDGSAASSSSSPDSSIVTPEVRWLDGVQGLTPPGCQSLLDPGSTGGMLDALAEGALGGPDRPLPPDLARALQVYRGRAFCG